MQMTLQGEAKPINSQFGCKSYCGTKNRETLATSAKTARCDAEFKYLRESKSKDNTCCEITYTIDRRELEHYSTLPSNKYNFIMMTEELIIVCLNKSVDGNRLPLPFFYTTSRWKKRNGLLDVKWSSVYQSIQFLRFRLLILACKMKNSN